MSTEEAYPTEVEEFIIKNLAQFKKTKDIIFEVCHKYDYSWPEAEKLVLSIMETNQEKIGDRRKPMIIAVNAGMLVGGLGIATVMAYGTFFGVVLWFTAFPIPYLPNIIFFISGIVMSVRGGLGLFKTLYAPKGSV